MGTSYDAESIERMFEAAEMLSSYVTYGSMRTPDQFDDRFQDIDALLPEALKQAPRTAWRAIIVTQPAFEQLQAGESLALDPRAFSSWSTSKTSAERFLRDRVHAAKPGEVGLLVEKATFDERVLVDMCKLYRTLDWDCSDVEEWGRYVEGEKEVIFHNSPRLLVIAPDEVCQAQPALRMQMVTDSPTAGVMRPFLGEWVYDKAEGLDFKVAAILESQAFLAEGGVWTIEGDNGEIYSIVRNGQEWETTGHLERIPIACS